MLDYEALPPRTAAALFYGLRDDARVKMKLSGASVSTETLLLAVIADEARFQSWTKTKDAQKNQNRPSSIVAQLTGGGKKESTVRAFDSAEAFEKERDRIIRGGE